MDTTAEKNDTEEQRLVEPRIIEIKLIDGSRINSTFSGLLRKKIRIDCLLKGLGLLWSWTPFRRITAILWQRGWITGGGLWKCLKGKCRHEKWKHLWYCSDRANLTKQDPAHGGGSFPMRRRYEN